MIARRNKLTADPSRDDREKIDQLIDKLSELDAYSLEDVTPWRYVQYKYYHARLNILIYLYEYNYGSLPF